MARREDEILIDARARSAGIRFRFEDNYTNVRVRCRDRDALADFQTSLRMTQGHRVSLADALAELLRANESRLVEEARRGAGKHGRGPSRPRE